MFFHNTCTTQNTVALHGAMISDLHSIFCYMTIFSLAAGECIFNILNFQFVPKSYLVIHKDFLIVTPFKTMLNSALLLPRS